MNYLQAIDWQQVKLFAQHASGISGEALLVIVAVALQLLAAHLLRSSVARPMPLILVLALALINEVNDLRIGIWLDPGLRLGEAARDLVLTMLVPTLIFLVARRRPTLLVQRSS